MLGLSVLAAATLATAAPAACPLSLSFQQPDNDGADRVAVWSGAAPRQALMFVAQLNVNADGAKRAYSVDDFWGVRRAIDTLCDAMTDACGGLSKAELRQRRIDTQTAYANSWPSDQLAKTKIASSIIPFKDGKPCPLADGFLVSGTALQKQSILDVCDRSKYVDSMTVPAIVIPGGANGFSAAGAMPGDLALAFVPGSTAAVLGVVGDLGPRGEIGEASVAMNGALKGKTGEPANYTEVKQKWVVRRAAVLIFPGTRNPADPYMTLDRINAAAAPVFAEWGGLETLKACIAAYSEP